MVVDISAGKNSIKNGVTELERAAAINRTLGTFTAARYMQKRNWSIEAALYWLVVKNVGNVGSCVSGVNVKHANRKV